MNGRSACTRCTKPLHMGKNFQDNRSDEDIFYDCLSFRDNDNGCKSSSCKSNNIKGSGCQEPTKSDSSRFDNQEAIRAALERVVQCAPMLLKNLEPCRKCCNATLEITARLITDSKDCNPNCRYQGRPVTMKMPLEFDPSTGQLGTKSAPSSSSHICHKPCHQHSHSGRVLSQQPQVESETESEELVFVGTCTPTIESFSREPMIVPFVAGLPPPKTPSEPESDIQEEVEWEPRALPEYPQEFRERSKEVESELVESPTPKTPILVGRYYMALPQHKDFSNCSPCRYSPSPIMDEDGNVFCPGNCGCCQCAWKRRSFNDNLGHANVKVCRCVQRGTIFSNFEDRETCSQTSYFDFCPCREKAEAKYLELYNCEMWSSEYATRGPEVQLDQIRELSVPPQPHQS